jgi:23S rRNA pseudouridine1911/1915/1917 synthase
MSEQINLQTIIPEELNGKRLDQALVILFPKYSRERLKTWISSGECKVNGGMLRGKDKVKGGEQVIISAILPVETHWQAEDLPLNIIYEDAELLVLNKQNNLVVHPAAGNKSGTLVNALLNYCPSLETLPRAGVVHRLDKDTTGLMVVAKTLISHTSLVQQLQARTIKRYYVAIVCGVMTAGGTVDAPIARHPRDRLKMAVVNGGKAAITHYRVTEKFAAHSLLHVELETGRTHQIRVHMTHIGYPILGDKLYGKRAKLPKGASEELISRLQKFPRQALHAKELKFAHPITGELLEFSASIPEDVVDILAMLREHKLTISS